MTEYTVHSATDTDLIQISQISLLTRWETGIHYSLPHLRRDREDPNREILVVRNEDGRVIAYGFLRYDPDKCFQPGTAAHPDLREPGAVAALNAERYRLAAARGYTSVVGYILSTNENSINYRLAEGWKIKGQLRQFTIVEYEFPQVVGDNVDSGGIVDA